MVVLRSSSPSRSQQVLGEPERRQAPEAQAGGQAREQDRQGRAFFLDGCGEECRGHASMVMSLPAGPLEKSRRREGLPAGPLAVSRSLDLPASRLVTIRA